MFTRVLRLPGLWLGPDDVWLTREGEMPDEPGLERMTSLSSVYLSHAWCSDAEHAEAVEGFLAALDLPISVDAATIEERAEPIAFAIESERVWVWERPVASVERPSPFPNDDPKPKGRDPEPGGKVTWIEIVLVDEDGQPVPRERYRVVLPDGKTRTGQLDDRGFARLEGIEAGMCDVSFPDIDGREWGPKGSR